MTNRRVRIAIAQCIALLVVVNVLSNRVVGSFSVVVNATAALALIAIARRGGATRASLGLGDGSFARGWKVARWFALVLFVTFVIGLALPATRGLFEDERVREMGIGAVLYRAFVAVPLGTVLLEEVAFRGVLPALFASTQKRWQGVVVASVLFGFWHVLPAWEISEVNPVLRDLLHGTAGQIVGIALGVATTAAIGLFWCWLRFRTHSLWTTAMVHVTSNSFGYLFAYAAWSLRH